MIFINNNEIFSQNNVFDFVLFLVTSFYCALRILKIIFPESGHYYLKVDIKESFIVLHSVNHTILVLPLSHCHDAVEFFHDT